MLFGLAMLAVAAAGLAPSAWQATAFFVVMQAFAAFSAWFLIARTAGSWSRADATIDLDLRRVGLPIMGVIFIQTFSDLLLLAQISAHASPADAGAFRVAFQIVNIVNLVLVTSESYVAARVAGDFRTARPDLAWHRHRRATLFMLMATAPVLVLTLVAPEPLLRIVFGPEFAVAASALFVMAIGQTVNILRGPIGSMLSMSGHDGVPLRLNLVSFLLLVVLSVTLIPTMGLTGAGIAQAVPVVFRAIAAYVVARRLIPDRAVAA
jgi:O-antigen/teichoic acid export membrane protein